MTTTREQKWDKNLYGRFKRLTNNLSHQKKPEPSYEKETLREKRNLS